MRNTFLFVPLLLLLLGCGGSSGGDGEVSDNAGAVRQVGIIEASEYYDTVFTQAYDALIVGVFIDLNETTQVATVLDNFLPAIDTCRVAEAVVEPDLNPAAFDIYGVTGPLVSAGDLLTVSSDAGSYVELTKVSFGGNSGPVYTSGDIVDAPIPNGLLIDIPGEEFPAYTAVSIPDVSPLINLQPSQTDEITVDSQFTWQPGSNAGERVVIKTENAYSGDSQATDLDFYCELTDDGFFEFPDEVKALLGDDFSSYTLNVYRESKSVAQQGDTLLLISRDRSDFQ